MNVVYLYADGELEWNCSHWRCHLLSNAIERAHELDPKGFPHRAKMYYLGSALDWHHPAVQKELGWADIIMVQRNIVVPAIWDVLDYWRALGKIVLVDLDDGYSCIPASNPAFAHWMLNSVNLDPAPVKALEEGLRHADALIAPNRVLLQDWGHVVAGYYWANYPTVTEYKKLKPRRRGSPDIIFKYDPKIQPEKLKPGELPKLLEERRPNSQGDLIIGWGGSLSHLDSFLYSGVIPALARILAEFPYVKFKFCGNDNRLDYLWKQLPEAQFIRQPGVLPRKHWPQVMSKFNIGIAPMDMRPIDGGTESASGEFSYDERRSHLKLVEYLCAGVPFVATRCHPYDELGKFGRLVENTAEDWYEALADVIRNYSAVQAGALATRVWALENLTIESRVEELIRLYGRIGEEAQAKAGLRLPNVLNTKPENLAADDERHKLKIADLPRQLYSGDPWRVGRAEHDARAQAEAAGLAGLQGLALDGEYIRSGWASLYGLTARLNAHYRGVNEQQRETETATPDSR